MLFRSWKTLYKTRTSIERLNSRLDEFFGFEKHYIRGLEKMKLRGGALFCSNAFYGSWKDQRKAIR